ncbi:MAG: tetratricopeptide repeat protein, partial [Verrucomicrobia bacterium]|nr:tetratricopeptide repeat protein [Verrucomicrobiota bacterium]
GKHAEAQAQFERFISLAPGSPFAAQAAYGVAASLEAGGKAAEAQTKYDEVAKRYSTDSVADDAKLALAGIFTAQNKPEQAHKILDELMQATRGGAASQAAFMKRNELEQKFPHLRTNTPPIRPAMPSFPTNILSTATSAVKQASAAGTNLLKAVSNAVVQPKAP